MDRIHYLDDDPEDWDKVRLTICLVRVDDWTRHTQHARATLFGRPPARN